MGTTSKFSTDGGQVTENERPGGAPSLTDLLAAGRDRDDAVRHLRARDVYARALTTAGLREATVNHNRALVNADGVAVAHLKKGKFTFSGRANLGASTIAPGDTADVVDIVAGVFGYDDVDLIKATVADKRAAEHDDAVNKEVERLRVQTKARRVVAGRDEASLEPVEGVTIGDFKAEEPSDDPWLIKGWWNTDSQVLVYSPGKVGKSYFVHYVAECLASGRQFLDLYQTFDFDGRIGIMDIELGRDKLRERLARYDRVPDDKVVVYTSRDATSWLDLTDPASIDAWAERLKADGVKVLFVDPVSALIRRAGMNEWTEGGLAMTRLQELQAKAGLIGQLVVMHASAKSGGDNGPRGDSGFVDVPDNVWHLGTEDDFDGFIINTRGRAETFTDVRAEWVDGDTQRDGQNFRFSAAIKFGTTPANDGINAHRAVAIAVRGEVERLIADHGPMFKSDLVDAVKSSEWNAGRGKQKLSRDRIRDAVTFMHTEGVLANVTEDDDRFVSKRGGQYALALTDVDIPEPNRTVFGNGTKTATWPRRGRDAATSAKSPTNALVSDVADVAAGVDRDANTNTQVSEV